MSNDYSDDSDAKAFLRHLVELIMRANSRGVIFTLPDENGDPEPFNVEDLRAHKVKR